MILVVCLGHGFFRPVGVLLSPNQVLLGEVLIKLSQIEG